MNLPRAASSRTGRAILLLALVPALATGALSEDIGLFFIGDGVLQLNLHQQPETIKSRHYAATFGVLALYEIEHCYLCRTSLIARGLEVDADRLLDVTLLDAPALRAGAWLDQDALGAWTDLAWLNAPSPLPPGRTVVVSPFAVARFVSSGAA